MGYLLEVDIAYPENLHESHRYLPFLPVRKDKLLTTLEDKQNYIVTITTLKQALDHGLSLQKVHRVISFWQEAWLKPYIDKNAELRKYAKNDFENDFSKLMNNAVFRKTMENVRNRRDVKLIVTERRRKKLVSEPKYDSCKHFSDILMAIEMNKTEVYLDKPIAVGQCILDKSKKLMFTFYYDCLLKKYQANLNSCYMDTDSFILDVRTDDFCKDISNDANEWFDTSYFNNIHAPIKKGINKKVIGKFKDELGGNILTKFVGLRAKTYSCCQINDDKVHEVKKAKGTKKCVIKKHLNFDMYEEALFDHVTVRCTQQRFTSDYHNIYTQSVHKIALNNNDTKIIISVDGVTTYPCGISTELLNKPEANKKVP